MSNFSTEIFGNQNLSTCWTFWSRSVPPRNKFSHQINFLQFFKHLQYFMPFAVQNHLFFKSLTLARTPSKTETFQNNSEEKMINHRKIWGKWRVANKNNLWISLTILELFYRSKLFFQALCCTFFSSWYIFPLFFVPRNDKIDAKTVRSNFPLQGKASRWVLLLRIYSFYSFSIENEKAKNDAT